MSRCKLNEYNITTILLNIHQDNSNNRNILGCNINEINICRSNTTLNLGGLGIFRAEDNNKKEDDLVEEEAKLYVIIMDNQDTLLDIVQVL